MGSFLSRPSGQTLSSSVAGRRLDLEGGDLSGSCEVGSCEVGCSEWKRGIPGAGAGQTAAVSSVRVGSGFLML